MSAAIAERNNARTAVIMAAIVAGMLGLAFASVPLYKLFCEVTGFAGTPIKAERAPGAVAGEIGVRFDANVQPGLPWRFEPKQTTVRIHPGAQTLVHYRSANLTSRPVAGQESFNVSPTQAGKYFRKIECFCFTEQTLQGGETRDMPVRFIVDPDLPADVKTITLS